LPKQLYYSAALYVGIALCISTACTITWGINSTPELFSDFYSVSISYLASSFFSHTQLSRIRHPGFTFQTIISHSSDIPQLL